MPALTPNPTSASPVLLPAIDLRGGHVVRLMQGDYDAETVYGADPADPARRFADAGASWLHVVDLDGARDGRPAHLTRIAAICRERRLQVEVGGGVRSAETIDQLLAAGVRRVVLGTAALADWAWFAALVQRAEYAGRLVLGLDARNGRVAVDGWKRQLSDDAVAVAQRVNGWPLGAIVYTDIATDGTMEGPNTDAVERIAAATDVPIVASGGVGTLAHLCALRTLPVAGVIVGRALYEHSFSIEQALVAFEGAH